MYKCLEYTFTTVNIKILSRRFSEGISSKYLLAICEKQLSPENKKFFCTNVFEDVLVNCNKSEIISSTKKKLKNAKRNVYDSNYDNNDEFISDIENCEQYETEESSIVNTENLQCINEMFNENLKNYVELCAKCNNLLSAYHTLHYYFEKSKLYSFLTISKPDSFNTLLHHFAYEGDLDKISDLMELMKKCKINFTAQTYAACFECIARLVVNSNTDEKIKIFRNQFELEHFTFQDLFDKCVYVKDQREYVIKAIRRLDPKFVQINSPPIFEYSNPLLNILNEKRAAFNSPIQGIACGIMRNKIKEQMQMEKKMRIKINSVNPISRKNNTNYDRIWNELQKLWRISVRERLYLELEILKSQQITNEESSNYKLNLLPYFQVLPLEDYIDIVVKEAIRLVQDPHVPIKKLNILYKEIGSNVQSRYIIQCKHQDGVTDKVRRIYEEYYEWYLHPEINSCSLNPRHQWQYLNHKYNSYGPSINIHLGQWSPFILKEIGKFLLQIIKEEIKVNVNMFTAFAPKYVPVFYVTKRYTYNNVEEKIKVHSRLVRLYNQASKILYFDVFHMPTIIPPIPWITPYNGLYISSTTNLFRCTFAQNKNVLKSYQELYATFDAINQLISVPWKINQQILDIMMQVFMDGGSEKLNIPTFPDKLDFANLSEGDLEKALHNRFLIWKRKKKIGQFLQIRNFLSMANYYRNQVFWYPHNIDFRGRAYPLSYLFFSYSGSDKTRSLLKFAKGQKLGSNGLDWLKIHCVNLTGQKAHESIQERLRFANEKLSDMLDSAENPLTGKMWWCTSGKIWQVLACCMEIKAALDSGDVENFISCLPIHQDGSFNCMQHLAALARDQNAAKNVNLIPSDKPYDLYDSVVTMIEGVRKNDADNGVKNAIMLEGFITRELLKKTIMASVYGLTKHGCQTLLFSELRTVKDFPSDNALPCSWYLRDIVFDCLHKNFTHVTEIQNWLAKFSKYVQRHLLIRLEWETPLGLLVVQPYVRMVQTGISKKYEESPVFFKTFTLRSYSKKQRQALPPNFIHCLDACHMMLTALYCQNENIPFISIHDCFCTLPCFVDRMNKICREQFMTLHSQPLLENLTESYKKKINSDEETFPELPSRGTYNLNDILESVYFFS